MNNIQYKRILYLLTIGIIYISISVLIFPDSTTFLSNAEYLIGEGDVYHLYRGPVYPMFLAIISKIFGFSNQGLLVAGLILYLLFAITVVLLLKNFFDKKEEIVIIVCSMIFILLNPVIAAFSHFILTEFIAMVLLSLFLLGFILIEKNVNKNKLLYKCVITFIFTTLLYGTKQMFFPYIIIFAVSIELINLKIKMIIKFASNIALLMLVTMVSLSLCSVGLNIWHNQISKETTVSQVEWTTGYSGVDSVESMMFAAVTDGLRYFVIENEDKTDEYYNVNVMSSDYKEILTTYERKLGSEPSVIITASTYVLDAFKASPKQFFKSYSDNYQALIEYKKIMGDNYKHCPVTQSGDIRNWRGELAYFTEHYKYLGDGFRNSVNVSWEHTELETKFNQEIDQSLVSNLLFNTYYYDLIKVLHTTFGLLAPFIMLVSFISLFASKYKKESEIIFILSFNFFFNTLALAVMGQPISRYAFPTMLFSMLFWTYVFVSVYKIGFNKISEKVKQRKIV